MKILIASANKGKIKEMERILLPFGFDVVSLSDKEKTVDVEETGETFKENAYIKAAAYYEAYGLPVIADDSGLCIDALGGRPGVRTARYGGEDTPYPEKFQLLFKELEHTELQDRTARFVSSICCIIDDDCIIEVTEDCQGYIGYEPAGDEGFGYDPIFYINDKSFAQLSPDEKDKISHRGKAIRKLESIFKEIL